ncbi:oxygen-independent coproporphyrinogen III oxidase [Parasutterella sp.]|uniref:oxygen-independent coproporphyrinogen III oxidase n=1 Tax=Parasutterella sp. TaxID=2049037 RepID=UPI00307DE540
METQGKLNVEFPDLELLQRFDVPGPRYTSYPTADRFTKEFGAEDFKKVLNARGTGENTADLSLYVHIPFCANVCFFCGCNKEVTKDHCRSKEYLEVLSKECELVSAEIGGNKEVVQLHFGGGSPTFLNNEEIFQVMDIIRSHFALAPDAEISIEVDPRSTPVDKVEVLAKAGFNRMSIGVQDFDNRVQIAVNRVQPFEMTKAVLDAARANDGFKSINMDLIYGLPFQSRKTFEMTLDKVIELSPDRIALYHFAHLPEHFKPQRRINAEDLPSTPEKVGIMMDAIKRLSANGYHFIGMDHFAKVTDELAKAQENGTLQRNFQGYSTKPECDMVALGVSSISKVNGCYAANPRDLESYYAAIRSGNLATNRGYLLNDDDRLRAKVIMELMCQFKVVKADIEKKFDINFNEYFDFELNNLKHFEAEGLVRLEPDYIEVTPKGKLLVRAVAMNFDRYLREDERVRRYSRIV